MVWLQLAFTVVVTALPCAAWADAPTGQFDELMSQAEAQRTSERHSEASRSSAAAYHALGPQQRTGLLGEIALDNAWADYESAAAADTELSLELTRAITALLETAISERSQAHRTGTADVTPQRWRDALSQVHPAPEPEPEPEPEPRVLAEKALPRHDVVVLHEADAEQPRIRAQPILTAGVIGVVAGGGVIAVGLATWKRVDLLATQSRASLVNEADSDDVLETRRADITRWERRGRGVATGVVVGGSALVATGAALVVWHTLRKRKRRTDANVAFHPMLSGNQVGVSITGRLPRRTHNAP